MIRPRPPPLRRLSKTLAAGVVGFVAFPGTLTATAAVAFGGQSTAPGLSSTAAVVALAAALVGLAFYKTQS